MSNLICCDSCGAIPKPGKTPKGWRAAPEYKSYGTRRAFVRVQHACPRCPMDVARPMVDDLPVCTVQEALLEVEEAARFSVVDGDELKGASRRLVVRALAMLDAAHGRLAGNSAPPPKRKD